MSIEEMCAAAIEAGNNCTVAFDTGPVTPEHGLAAVIAFGVVTGLSFVAMIVATIRKN